MLVAASFFGPLSGVSALHALVRVPRPENFGVSMRTRCCFCPWSNMARRVVRLQASLCS